MDSSRKVYTFSQIKSHNHKKDCWLIISGKVYDVTSFLDDHPGGDDVLLLATGKDATNDFKSVGHSDNAKELMEKFCVGKIEAYTLPARQGYRPPPPAEEHKPESAMGFSIKVLQLLLPLLILPLAFAIHFFTKSD